MRKMNKKQPTDTPTLMKKIHWSLKMACGGFKHTKGRAPNLKDQRWLEKLQLKVLQGKQLTSKESTRLDVLYSEMSPDGHDDHLRVINAK